ncbi:hypothetical protein CHN51_02175 [Sphingorhabdus sp. YGSMI21]|nr:hypothetical protein CHN51_02175 [Sphingorhabdus sp. YGSMI21]
MIALLAVEFENGWRKEADENWTWTPPDETGSLTVTDMMLVDFGAWKAEQDLTEIVGYWTSTAQSLAERQGLVLDPTDPDRLDGLCWALNDAAVEVCVAIQNGTQGTLKPQSEPLVSVRPKGTSDNHCEAFEALVVKVMDLPNVDISPSVRQETSTALRFLQEAFGSPTPAEITRPMVTVWIQLLAKRPRQLPKEHRNIPLKKLAEMYEGRVDVERLAPQTYQGRVSCLAKRWDELARTGLIDQDLGHLANPFRGHPQAKKRPSKASKGFSPEELSSIFSLPIFTAGERPNGGKGEASYWIPLILFTTGARPEEVAQLLVSDFWEVNGHWLMKYTDEGEHPVKGQQSLKTDGQLSGRRTLPVPQRLIDLKLPEYLKYLKAQGEVALFPLLRTKGSRNLLFSAYGEWWSLYLRSKKVLPKGRKASREFRHVWTTAARGAKVSSEARSYIQGHRINTGNSQSEYGHFEALGEHIHLVDPQGPDWSKVISWKA